MADETSAGPVPPYVSWATLNNKLEEMGRNGIPSRIDASYLVGMAGGTQAQFKQALRSLGLIEANDRVTRTLIELVQDPNGRPERVGDLLRERYPALTGLTENATPGELDEVLGNYGLGKDTRRKAASFYVAAATYAGLPLSPHIKPRTSAGNGAGTRTVRRRATLRKGAGGASESAPGTSSQPGAVTHSIDLASGGTVTVAVSMNIFELSRTDRTFVLGLVDSLQDYPNVPDSPSRVATGGGTTEGRAS